MNDSGWRFDEVNSMTIDFDKRSGLGGASYVKSSLRSSAKLNIQNEDESCFIWSLLAHLQPIAGSKNGHAKRVSNSRIFF